MEPKGSLWCLQTYAIGPYTDSDKYSPHPPTLLF
jgi:hypothetical protein